MISVLQNDAGQRTRQHASTGPDAVIGDFGIAVAERARSGGDTRRRVCRAVRGHPQTMSQPKVQARERILSVRRAVISLGIGVFVGALAATFGAPELFPLTSWTVPQVSSSPGCG
jgi:hypothetical protein